MVNLAANLKHHISHAKSHCPLNPPSSPLYSMVPHAPYMRMRVEIACTYTPGPCSDTMGVLLVRICR